MAIVIGELIILALLVKLAVGSFVAAKNAFKDKEVLFIDDRYIRGKAAFFIGVLFLAFSLLVSLMIIALVKGLS